MENRQSLLNILSSALGGYLTLRTDDFRKRMVSGLSEGFSRVLAMIVVVMLLMIAIALFAFGAVAMIGDLIGSWGLAAFMVGGVCLIGVLILFMLRKKLFSRMFSNVFSELSDSSTMSPDMQSLPLLVVRYLRSRLDE